jgi:phospholipid/cholesterol/gamma-HCH transport system permease protein
MSAPVFSPVATGTVDSYLESPDTLVVVIKGAWEFDNAFPDVSVVATEMDRHNLGQLRFDADGLETWHSGLVAFLLRTVELAQRRGLAVDMGGLPSGLENLLILAMAVPEKSDARKEENDVALTERVGLLALSAQASAGALMKFLGEVTLAFGRMIRGKARYRREDFSLLIQQAGLEAVPIVTLVCFLLGLILAFVGAIQLQAFGATILVADLVGIAMVRDMAALMTAIVMAGRSGAAYAAQIGSMKATQETDALSTMGISIVEFLVLPRVLALFLMMPLLTLYADFVGILGGGVVGVAMLDLSPTLYLQQTSSAVNMEHVVGGLFKAGVYGVLVAVAGCLRGIQSGKSSSAVGDAATAAVVTAIVWIIVACGIFAYLFYLLGL